MELCAGLDVSVAETSLCVVDADGKVIRETKMPTEPEAIIAALVAACTTGASWKRIGLEAGPLSQWLFSALVEAGYPAICVETRHMKAALVRPLLVARRALREQFARMHKMLLDLVRDEPVCRRLMTAPGVGAVVALAYRVTIDVPARFERSKAVGAALGLTPRRYQSGEIDRTGRISKCGDGMLRSLLFEAAQCCSRPPRARTFSRWFRPPVVPHHEAATGSTSERSTDPARGTTA